MTLNVSEDHMSTIGSPVSAPNSHAIVQLSPATRTEDRERDDNRAGKTEVVEDSYKEMVQNDAQPGRLSPALQDPGHELYDLSPKAKDILEAKIQAKKIIASEQVASDWHVFNCDGTTLTPESDQHRLPATQSRCFLKRAR